VALAIDATATAATTTAGATSLSNANLTVGAGATSLLAAIIFQEQAATPGTINAPVWDSVGANQPTTRVATIQSTNTNLLIELYGLVNPTSGNKTLSCSWGTSVPAVLNLLSFSGGVTTSVATAFVRSGTNFAVSGAETLSLTGAAGNISVCVAASVPANITSLTTTGSTSWFTNNVVASAHVSASTAPSATSITWTGAPTSTEWNIAGIDVVAAVAATIKPYKSYVPIWGPLLAR
jgi:hypothetical protein